MTTRDTVERFTDAVERGDFDTAASFLADGFQFSTEMRPEPMGADEWLYMTRALRYGMPDFSYNFHVEEVDGNVARVSSQLSGTHTEDLDLSIMGLGVIPPTGRSFTAEREYSEGVVNDHGKIQNIHVFSSPDTGIASMLRQIGVQMPGG